MKALMMTIAMMLVTMTVQAQTKDPALTKTFDLVSVQREEKAAYKALLESLGENPEDREFALKRMDMVETSDAGELRIVMKPQG